MDGPGFSGDKVWGVFAISALGVGDIEGGDGDALRRAVRVFGPLSSALGAARAGAGDTHGVAYVPASKEMIVRALRRS